MDYRKTLNLPNQEFTVPMRARLPELELKVQNRWRQMGLYHRMQERAKGRPKFILHDGPPYTNNPLHIGTAMNRILKDFIVRFKAATGYEVPFVPGFDNHGMPIEQAVMKAFRDEGLTPTRTELCRACREHAQKYIDLQTEQSQRLGEIGDWERRYASMDFTYEANLMRAFGELVDAGYVYRGLRPVTWCPTCVTALAEAEVEYDDHTSEAVYVAFPLREDPKGVMSGYPNPCALVWTTTPWTIPANLAIAADPNLEYALVRASDRTYLLLTALVRVSMEEVGITDYEIVSTMSGEALQGMVFSHPIFDRPSPMLMVDYIKADEGTGLVHTAPGHGAEDFVTGRQYGLEILCPVDGRGFFTKEAGEFEGLPIVPDGNQRVVQRLRETGTLLKYYTYPHQYPHCWRCHTPLVFRATNQWFINIDHKGLRQTMLEEIKKTQWFPSHSVNRIGAMVEARPDWCISRQRTWGIPIPAYYAPGNADPLLTKEVVEKAAELVEKRGIEGWYEATPAEVLGNGAKLDGVPAEKLEKETDILDVWFDSGCSHYMVLGRKQWPELSWPADVYIEGSDQHRGWFNTSLITACALKGSAPYRQVITHGFVLDAEYRAMSKSRGNVLEPMEMAEKYGADILRLWAANISYFEDVAGSEELIQKWGDAFRRVRNTLRFLVANLFDFDESKAAPLLEIDRWAIHRLNRVLTQVRAAFGEYEFHRGWAALQLFCTQDLSAYYMDVTKDRLYCEKSDSPERRGAQTAYLMLASAITRAAAPILCHSMEEVWERLPLADRAESVHLTDFPEPLPHGLTSEEESRWNLVLHLRDEVNRELEDAKTSGLLKDTLEAAVGLTISRDEREQLRPLESELATVFKVSHVDLAEGERALVVSLAPGTKCARCWLRRTDVGSAKKHPALCARCAAVVSGT
jgi:isoleucyl-tRNA synthetase